MIEIVSEVLNICLVILYWLSLVFIGYAVIHYVWARFFEKKDINGVTNNPFLLFILSFAASVLLLGVFSVPLYALRVSSLVYTVFYIALFLWSVLYFAPVIGSLLSKRFSIKVGGWGFWVFLSVVLGYLGIIAADYLISSVFGAQFAEGSDTYVHVAKILSIVQFGFSIDDGFFRGVAETRYHYNAIYPLYIPITHLFGLIPADSWNASTGFFRLLQWVTSGALMFFVVARFLKQRIRLVLLFSIFSSLATMIALNGKPGFMHVAMYPNTVEVVWLALFAVGLYLLVGGHKMIGAPVVLGASLLITLTHPTYSLMAALFVVVFSLTLAILKLLKVIRLGKEQGLVLFGAFIILMLSPVVTILFPDRMTAESFNYGGFSTVRFIGVDILPVALPKAFRSIIVAAVSIIGYGYLSYVFWKSKKYVELALTFSFILFIYLIIHNPIFMMVAGDILPLWLLMRFGVMNVLSIIAVPLGVFAAYVIITRVFHKKRPALFFSYILLGLLVLGVSLYSVKGSYRHFYNSTKAIDHGYLDFARRTNHTLVDVIPAGSLVIANKGDSYFLPALIPVKVIAIHSAHATPEAASDERLSCQVELYDSSFDNKIVAASGADYIVLAKWEDNFKTLFNRLENDVVYNRVADTADYLVYKVDKNHKFDIDKNNACYKYRVIEGHEQL